MEMIFRQKLPSHGISTKTAQSKHLVNEAVSKTQRHTEAQARTNPPVDTSVPSSSAALPSPPHRRRTAAAPPPHRRQCSKHDRFSSCRATAKSAPTTWRQLAFVHTTFSGRITRPSSWGRTGGSSNGTKVKLDVFLPETHSLLRSA